VTTWHITTHCIKEESGSESWICLSSYQNSFQNMTRSGSNGLESRFILTLGISYNPWQRKRALWHYHVRRKEPSKPLCSPGVVLKSRMRWCDCSRSGLLDDRVPLTGRAAGMCFVCLSPTMLSSWDWPIPISLGKEESEKVNYQQDKKLEDVTDH
jgi:hypothetical protein